MAIAPKTTTPIKSAHSPHAHPDQSAPRLMSFERPHYFCGHLLTDADLSLEQRYFSEKIKLYHRSLHGHGIVRGLRLTCDHTRSGGIFVGAGYAIDNQGHDLIVPVRVPLDVVGALIEKGLIAQERASDPCQRKANRSECHFQQCFYITICYQEDQADFATPLVTACQPLLSECEPTRISETVRFEVVDTLAHREEAALKRRLESCFKLFSEGPFAQALQTHQLTLGEIISPQADSPNGLERYQEYSNAFFELRGLLLLYLKKNPDQYHRTLDDEIRKIDFPEFHTHSEKARENYRQELRDTFFDLLALAWQHAVSGALGELLPPCHEPSEAHRVSLGTVVVENGRIVRVCNSPRSYVLSLANLPEVMLANLMGGLASEKEEDENSETADEKKATRARYCRDFDFDLGCFLQWLNVSPKAPFYASTELLRWLETIRKSIQEGFDFTNPCNFSTKIFEGMDEKKATDILKSVNLQSRTTDAPLEKKAPNLFALVQTAGLATEKEPILMAVQDSFVTSATLENSELLNHINNLYGQIGSLKAHVERLQAQRQTGG